MVTGVEHRTTKKGKPFGSFEMEDYKDSYKFTLFGEDYLKMKHYMHIGNFLMLVGKSPEASFSERER